MVLRVYRGMLMVTSLAMGLCQETTPTSSSKGPLKSPIRPVGDVLEDPDDLYHALMAISGLECLVWASLSQVYIKAVWGHGEW